MMIENDGDKSVFEIEVRDENQENPIEEEPMSIKKKIIICLIVLISAGILYFLWKYFFDSPDYLKKFINFCEGIKEPTPLNIFLIVCVVLPCQFCFVPGHSALIIVVSYFIGKFWPAFIRFILIIWPVKIIGFIIVKKCLYQKAYKAFSGYDIYKAMKHESKTSPWITSLILNCFVMLASLKMYIIPILSIEIYQFIPTMIFGESLGIMQLVIIGIQLKDIQMIFKVGLMSLSKSQRYSSTIFLFFTCFTVISMIVIFYVITKRVRQIKLENATGEENQALVLDNAGGAVDGRNEDNRMVGEREI